MRGAFPNAGDPCAFDESSIILNVPGNYRPTRDTAGKVLATNQHIDTSIRNLFLFCVGQSLMVNVSPTAVTVANPTKLDNLDPYSGRIFQAADPLMGCSLMGALGTSIGNLGTKIGDTILTGAYFDRVIIVNVAIDGSIMYDWGFGVLRGRLPAAIARALQIRTTAGVPIVFGSTTNVTATVMIAQGESDTLAGTSQASWTASHNQLWTNAVAAGFVGKWFVAKETWFDPSFSAAVQAAQTSNSPSGVINNAAGIYKGANADFFQGSTCGVSGTALCRRAGDNVHWDDGGIYSVTTDATNGWITAMHTGGLF